MAVKHKPDVVLLDIRMPDSDGLDALDKIHRELPDTRVVMLSTYDNPTYVARAVALGASDYVLKGASRQELISTITGRGRGQVALGHRRAAARRRRHEQELCDEQRRRDSADQPRDAGAASRGAWV